MLYIYWVQSTQRNVFQHWKIYTAHKVQARKDRHKANTLYNIVLKRKILRVLSNNARQRNYRNIAIMKKYFHLWLKYAHQNYTLKISHRSSSDVYLKNVVRFRKTSTVRKPSNKYSETDTCKEYKDKSVSYYRRNFLKRHFFRWKMHYDINRRNKLLQEKAIMYYSRRLLSRYLKQLRLHASKMKEKRILLREVQTFFNRKLLFKSYSMWRNYCRKKIENSVKVHTFREKINNKTQNKVFHHWRSYVYCKKCAKRKNNLALNLRKKRLMINTLKKLRCYVLYRNGKKIRLTQLNNRILQITYHVQEIYVKKWREALGIVMLEKRKNSQATEFRVGRLRRKFFFLWKRYSKEYKIKQQRKNQLHDIASSFVLKRYIQLWRIRCTDVLKFHQKENQAVSMDRKKTLSKYMHFWKIYVERKFTKKGKLNAPKNIHKKFLISNGLEDTLYPFLKDRYKHHRRNIIGSSHGDLRILNKYFGKWLSVVYSKNDSKSPYLTEERTPHNIQWPSINSLLGMTKSTHLVLPEYMINSKNNISGKGKYSDHAVSGKISKSHCVQTSELNSEHSLENILEKKQMHSNKNHSRQFRVRRNDTTNLTNCFDQSGSDVSSSDSTDSDTDHIHKHYLRDNCTDFVKNGMTLLPPSAFLALQ